MHKETQKVHFFFLNYISSSLTSPVNNSYWFSLFGAFVQMGSFGASFVLTPLSW